MTVKLVDLNAHCARLEAVFDRIEGEPEWFAIGHWLRAARSVEAMSPASASAGLCGELDEDEEHASEEAFAKFMQDYTQLSFVSGAFEAAAGLAQLPEDLEHESELMRACEWIARRFPESTLVPGLAHEEQCFERAALEHFGTGLEHPEFGGAKGLCSVFLHRREFSPSPFVVGIEYRKTLIELGLIEHATRLVLLGLQLLAATEFERLEDSHELLHLQWSEEDKAITDALRELHIAQ